MLGRTGEEMSWEHPPTLPVQSAMQWKHYACLALALSATTFSHARVNVVTLPGRDSVQLTIYNSVDLTLVKETRHLTFKKGLNRLEFSWANTLIDPTSVEFRPLAHADAVEVLDVSFPPRAANTLEWRINSEVAGDVPVEIRYFTSGISWSADYVVDAVQDESSMALAGHVRVNNQSGEDYEGAQLRLVVGVVRLVEDIARLAGRRSEVNGSSWFFADAKMKQEAQVMLRAAIVEKEELQNVVANQPKQVTREALSEYFLYTVEGRDTIPHGWARRLPSFQTNSIPLQSFYKYERETWGDDVVRFYRFTNSEPARLGKEPLPDGEVKAFRSTTPDQLRAFVGRTAVKYIPVNEKVDLELGRDPEVTVRPTMTNWAKTDLVFDNRRNLSGWTEKQWWQVEVQNSKDIPVTVEVRRNFTGDWQLESRAKHEAVDAKKVKFVLPLRTREKTTVSYLLTVRHGTSARR
jgi:hypothetical protein